MKWQNGTKLPCSKLPFDLSSNMICYHTINQGEAYKKQLVDRSKVVEEKGEKSEGIWDLNQAGNGKGGTRI
ncbi:hypothetical protein T458_13295 [Brevibacillus panacihumi W25]|uniref:Uncharacterized protein n=1 Tax=Brevibacillus panacihumi W25 TaxID=1408254 RepID=V6M9Q3_9BACL|nr:hypothetical protein T458_13295 [Brevibacillus panacihumi W25]